MRLTTAQVQRTLSQFNAQAVPEDHPMIPQLNSLFGEHTYFLDGDGLSVVEPAEAHGDGTAPCRVVNLANWADANLTSLAPHEPEPTDVVIMLEPTH